MKVKQGFELRRVAGESVVVATGVENIDFSKIIALNSSAAYLWQKVEKSENFTTETLAQLLVEQYIIDGETALNDAINVAQRWVEVGVVER